MNDLVAALKRARNATLLLGAGISIPCGIPAGYALFMEFGAAHEPLLRAHGLHSLWEEARQHPRQWTREREFTDALAARFPSDPALQEAVVRWLMDHQGMAGGASDDHAVFVALWLQRVFRHLVTTNWDFLLEAQLEAFYDAAYQDPFAPAGLTLSNGQICRLPSEALFFAERLDEEEYAWNPRWEIMVNERDLVQLPRWSRPIWKIHGSPFFLLCPRCLGINRWKRTEDLSVGDPCPEHPDVALAPEIIFWGRGVDTAYPRVWSALRGRIGRSDLILACGFSGADTYIREEAERRGNVWVVNPSAGEWDTTRVRHIPANAAQLAEALLTAFPVA